MVTILPQASLPPHNEALADEILKQIRAIPGVIEIYTVHPKGTIYRNGEACDVINLNIYIEIDKLPKDSD